MRRTPTTGVSGGAARPDREEQSLPLHNALRQGALGLVVVLLVGLVAGWCVAGLAGVWGALIGGLIAGVFELATVVMVLLTRNLPPTTTLAVILGSWLLKILLVLVVVVAIKDLTFYDRGTFFAVLAGVFVVVLGAETRAIYKTRVPYVSPVHNDDENSSDRNH